MRLAIFALGIALITAPASAWVPGERLSGVLELPLVCGSKATLQKLRVGGKTDQILALQSSDCRYAPDAAGFVLKRREGDYALIELVNMEQTPWTSEGLWWAYFPEVAPYLLPDRPRP